ncbi:unnamed protein product, partial [Pocillopora meandrina]
VIFDSNLTFHEHIIKTVSTCFSSLAQINRVKHVFDRSTLITIINTLFLMRGNVSGCTTRSSQLLHIPLYKTKSGQRTFYYRTVSLWNSLDNDLKLCNSSSNFKRKLRAKLFAAFLSPRS